MQIFKNIAKIGNLSSILASQNSFDIKKRNELLQLLYRWVSEMEMIWDSLGFSRICDIPRISPRRKKRENIISESNADMNMNGSTGITMSFICEVGLSYANGIRSSFGCMNIQNTLWLDAVAPRCCILIQDTSMNTNKILL